MLQGRSIAWPDQEDQERMDKKYHKDKKTVKEEKRKKRWGREDVLGKILGPSKLWQVDIPVDRVHLGRLGGAVRNILL